MTLTRNEVEQIVDLAVEKCLLRLGLDLDDAKEMREDFVHLRRSRQVYEKAGLAAVTSFIGIVTTGVAYAIWNAVSRH